MLSLISSTFPRFGSWVSDNTALLEEIASHGYIVCAVVSPGFAGGVLCPRDGQFVTARKDYPEINALMNADTIPNLYLANYTDDLEIRYARMELYLEQGTLPMLVQRLNDDLVDHLDAITRSSSSRTSTKSFDTDEVDPFLKGTIGTEK